MYTYAKQPAFSMQQTLLCSVYAEDYQRPQEQRFTYISHSNITCAYAILIYFMFDHAELEYYASHSYTNGCIKVHFFTGADLEIFDGGGGADRLPDGDISEFRSY